MSAYNLPNITTNTKSPAYQHLPNITTNTKSPGKPAWEEDRVEDTVTALPLPDIVLCSALSAGIAQARRHRRQRHPATVQTPGSLTPNNDPDTLMEPLIPDLETVSIQPEPSSSKRRKTDGSRLRSVAVTNVNIKQKTITIEDTPLGVFNGLMTLLRKITSSN